METKVDFRQELSKKLAENIGYPLQAEWITYDNPGFYYYIRSLQEGHPICVMHYRVMPGDRPQLMVVLAYADYQRLEQQECSVDEYIETSHWYFGYYWGGGSLHNAYWRPFGAEAGIHDHVSIMRYLWQLSCRTYVHALGHKNPSSLCSSCPLEASSCYCSELNQTGDRKLEATEIDRRIELRKALTKRVVDELGFEVSSFLPCAGARGVVNVYSEFDPNTVRVTVSSELLNELLYYPEEQRDYAELANSLRLVVKLNAQQADMSDCPVTTKSWLKRIINVITGKLGIARNVFYGK